MKPWKLHLVGCSLICLLGVGAQPAAAVPVVPQQQNQKDDGQQNQKDDGQQNQKDDGQQNQNDNGQMGQNSQGQPAATSQRTQGSLGRPARPRKVLTEDDLARPGSKPAVPATQDENKASETQSQNGQSGQQQSQKKALATEKAALENRITQIQQQLSGELPDSDRGSLNDTLQESKWRLETVNNDLAKVAVEETKESEHAEGEQSSEGPK